MKAKLYFYAKGQSARARGWSRTFAENYYAIESTQPFVRIYFDKGFRGLSL